MPKSNITHERYTIHNEDCLLVLASMPDESIDSIVTDPPYLISFMGKDWDSGDGIAGQPDVWRECLRVLKPGGHLLAFGATRTYHRMTVAIEDAGFEIRDSIHWTYGSGFPKSLDVSKAIDKAAGAERKVVGKLPSSRAKASDSGFAMAEKLATAPATEEAADWQGWGTALKPSHEPIVVARKPLAGTVAQTVLEYGTGAINIDGTRVGASGGTTKGNPPKGKSNGIYGDGLNGACDIVPLNAGRWPANTILTHAAGCQATGETVADTMTGGFGNGGIGMSEIGAAEQSAGKGAEWQERTTTVPVYRCVQGCPVAEMDKQSGKAGAAAPASGPSYSGPSKSNCMAGAFKGNGDKPPAFHADTGGASRFFTQCEWDAELDAPFLYVAKPAKKERNAGLDGLPIKRPDHRTDTGMGTFTEKGVQPQSNFHPTVKPVALMRHLCRLVTPPGGVVLDPFTGSGTTGVAALLEGFEFIGIEMTEEYIPIVEARLQHAEQSVREQVVAQQPDLFSEEAK